MRYITMAVPVIVAFYTMLFGIENWREKNVGGFIAITILTVVIVALPVYVLFWMK